LKSVAALIALFGSSCALADVSHINVKLRPWGSSGAWSDSLTLQSPNLTDAIQVEVGVFYHWTTGVALSTVIHNIVGSPYSGAQGDLATVLDNPTSSLHLDGRLSPYNWGGQYQPVYHTGTSGIDANRFRIAASGNPDDVSAGGVSIKQKHPTIAGSSFDTSNPAYAYHFKLSLACYNNGAPRTVSIDAPLNRIQSFRTYASVLSTYGTDVPDLSATDQALVTVSWVPGWGALWLLGGAGLLRRQRAEGTMRGTRAPVGRKRTVTWSVRDFGHRLRSSARLRYIDR